MHGSLIIIIWQYDDHHLQFTNPKTIQISGNVMFTIIPQNNHHHFKFTDCHTESFFLQNSQVMRTGCQNSILQKIYGLYV